MKNILKNLTFWVAIAIIAGVLLGSFAPELAVKMKFLSDYFIQTIKIFIIPIIFLTITLGISSMSSLQAVGKTGGKALLYFEIVTTFALLIGVAVAYLIKPGSGIDPTKTASNGIIEVEKYKTQAHDFSFFHFIGENPTLQVLLIAIVIGVLLIYLKPKNTSETEPFVVLVWLKKASKYVFQALHIVMLFAPLAAFGGMAYTIGKFGVSALIALASLMLTFYTTVFLFVFVILNLILRYYDVSLWKLLRFINPELLLVLGTASSESALPAIMEKLEQFGCEKSVVSLVIPAGYSFNLDGTTIYLSMAIIFLAQAYQIDLSLAQIGSIVGVLMLSSKGAAGVVGSAFVVLASTLQTIHIIPVEGLALLFGVDRFMAEARSITNIIGNSVATVFIANQEKAFNRAKYEQI